MNKFEEIMKSIDMEKYRKLSLEERRKLLNDILRNVKKYKYLKLDDPRKKRLLSEKMDALFRDIYNNYELVKSDSGIILSNRKIVQRNLEDERNLENINRQRKLLNLIYSMNFYFLIPMFNDNTTIMAYDKNDIINSKCIAISEVKVNEDSSITKESINDKIIDHHNEILRLAKEIRHRNL